MIRNIINGYKDVFNFLKSPEDTRAPIQTRKQRFIGLIQILVLDLVVAVLISILIYFLKKQDWISTIDNQLNNLFPSMPLWLLFCSGVIVAPFLEELIFRHPLRFNTNIVVKTVVWFSSLFGKPEKRHKTKEKLNRFWRRRFGLLFYSSTILFALVHLRNYTFENTILYFLPILVLLQFFFGLFAGYIRIRYNFFLGFCLHASHNAILILIPFIFTGQSSQIFAHKNDYYSLKIEKVNFGMGNSSIVYGDDTLSFQNVGLKSVISQLSGKKEILIKSNDAIRLNSRINLQFIDYQNKKAKKQTDTILKYLSVAFKFSTKTRVKKQNIYWLDIIDSTKLKMNRSEANSVKITMPKNKIKMENVPLTSLAGIVTSNLDKLTLCDTIEGRFNFTLPKDPEKLRKTLVKKYGIKIVEKKKNMEYLFINFDE